MNKNHIALIFQFSILIEIEAQCYKRWYERGVGQPVTSCQNGSEINGALCYENCQSGYKGNGPICWEICKPGYSDYGLLCYRSEFIYSKKINNFNNDKMKSFKPCLNDYKDMGMHCKLDSNFYIKKSYSRGFGEPLSCDSEYEQDAGLCYKKCNFGYVGAGPLCWINCENVDDNPFECGITCTANDKQCASFTSGAVGAGVGILVTGLLSPISVTGDLYTSVVSGAVGGASAVLFMANLVVFDACNPKNGTFVY